MEWKTPSSPRQTTNPLSDHTNSHTHNHSNSPTPSDSTDSNCDDIAINLPLNNSEVTSSYQHCTKTQRFFKVASQQVTFNNFRALVGGLGLCTIFGLGITRCKMHFMIVENFPGQENYNSELLEQQKEHFTLLFEMAKA